MAKLYWTRDMKQIFDQKIHAMMEKAIDDPETGVGMLAGIKICREFANDVIKDMEELDRQEEEARRKEA